MTYKHSGTAIVCVKNDLLSTYKLCNRDKHFQRNTDNQIYNVSKNLPNSFLDGLNHSWFTKLLILFSDNKLFCKTVHCWTYTDIWPWVWDNIKKKKVVVYTTVINAKCEILSKLWFADLQTCKDLGLKY